MKRGERRRGDTIRHKVPDGMHTMQDVANLAEVSRGTIKHWHKAGYLPHSDVLEVGALKVYLFNDDAVTLAQGLARSRTRLDRRVEELTQKTPPIPGSPGNPM